jgi:phosphoribosylaminoimidazolecarboxamide formyltransferase/IMP cyclohydrolase
VSTLRVRRALISVFDKTGIVPFARALHEELGAEILSTGGTAAMLTEYEIPVTLVEQVTGSAEMLDGRVKTLHPAVHAAILADRSKPEHMEQLAAAGVKPIDMVVVNLYPFGETIAEPECTLERAIEMIDIGGPTMLRAAAKNHAHVWVLPTPEAMSWFLQFMERGGSAEEEVALRRRLAALVFSMMEDYDGLVAEYLTQTLLDLEDPGWQDRPEPSFFAEPGQALIKVLEDSQPLRYGENPHQQAAYLREAMEVSGCVTPESVVSGSELSFNNFADANAAVDLAKELTRELTAPGKPAAGQFACVVVKHTNPCGVGLASSPAEAYRRAYLGDPNAAMGGVMACNFPVEAGFAEEVMQTYDRLGREAGAGGFFLEVWAAPGFTSEAVAVIQQAKAWGQRVRLLGVGDMAEDPLPEVLDYRRLTGGMLVQSCDLAGLDEGQWQTKAGREPTAAEWSDLRLAWLICKHTKSNAITVCKDGMLLGSGAGQTSRVMSCRIATWLARDNGHGERLAGAVAASDAFFPFADGPEVLAEAGVTALIQPGGSKRDEDTISFCKDRDLALVLTGTRHFKH